MGFAKARMMQEEAQGFAFSDKKVCTHCVDDYALEAALADEESADEQCSFCGSSPAASLDVLLAAFLAGLRTEYGDADNEGVIYETAEGGYQWGEKWDTWDLVWDHSDVLIGEGLVEAVAGASHDRMWVRRNFAWPRRDEALSAGWQRFREAVMYETRFVFWLRPDPDAEEAVRTGEVPATRILDEVGQLIEDLGLMHELPAGQTFWRAQAHDARSIPLTAKRLGTAPPEKANQANRMSPAGIPMFYGAADSDTAVREVAVRNSQRRVSAGEFVLSRPCWVIDFTQLPPIPSMFDPEDGYRRRAISFMHAFVDDLSRPARKKSEQIDYVPTQVMTEYLLRVRFADAEFSGLVYASRLTGRRSVVLNIGNVGCVEVEPGWDTEDQLRLGLRHETVFCRDIRSEERAD